MMARTDKRTMFWLAMALCLLAPLANAQTGRTGGLREINTVAAPDAASLHAIVGVILIDGRGGPAVPDATVVIRGNRIEAAGPRHEVTVPEGTTVFDGAGLSVLPGLIDAHFHVGVRGMNRIPQLWLTRGITSVRDPGFPGYQGHVPAPAGHAQRRLDRRSA